MIFGVIFLRTWDRSTAPWFPLLTSSTNFSSTTLDTSLNYSLVSNKKVFIIYSVHMYWIMLYYIYDIWELTSRLPEQIPMVLYGYVVANHLSLMFTQQHAPLRANDVPLHLIEHQLLGFVFFDLSPFIVNQLGYGYVLL